MGLGKRKPYSQAQWKEYLQNLVQEDEKALLRAIVVIGQYQTPEELALAETVDHNNWGWGTIDAKFFTGCYFKLLRGEALTRKELAIARNKMPKYWRQLMLISKRKYPDRPPSQESSQYVVREDGQLAIREVVL